jgi:hypothetical protein
MDSALPAENSILVLSKEEQNDIISSAVNSKPPARSANGTATPRRYHAEGSSMAWRWSTEVRHS